MPRFGVSIIPSATGRSDPVAQARRAEELGFDLVSIWDHPHGANPSFETWTLMTWIAARTTRIHVASDVLGLPFRLPALTAKMAETLDRLSDGRFILGLGGGGDDEEFAGLGAPVRTPSEKVGGARRGTRRHPRRLGQVALHLPRQALPQRDGVARAQTRPSHPDLARDLRPEGT